MTDSQRYVEAVVKKTRHGNIATIADPSAEFGVRCQTDVEREEMDELTAFVANHTMLGLIMGVAPDAELVSIRIFGPSGQGGSFEDHLLAIKYATEIDVDIVNLSLGSGLKEPQENSGGIRGTFNPVCQTALNEGTIITTSSGNGGERYQ